MRLPRTVTWHGESWRVARAWPARGTDAPVPVELRRGDLVRGAHWGPGEGLQALPEGVDPRLPGLTAALRRGRLVSHRPGRRAVVRVGAPADGAGGTARSYEKVVRPGRAAALVEAHRRGAVFADAFVVGEARLLSDDTVSFAALPGASVHELGRTADDGEWHRLWATWADAWPAAVASAPVGDWPRHEVSDECTVLETWAGHAASATDGRLTADALQATARRIGDRLRALPRVRAVVSHRDLHDQQLLWDADRGLALIDLDTSALADPALDLGNLAAHADLARAQGRWTPERAATAGEAIAQTADAIEVSPERLDAWRTAARFRVACVHSLRPDGRAVAEHELRTLVAEHTRDGG
ncbi:phosphotransferase [Microbacterium marinilacus]|uniref:Aminoglycoside phosphotransferase domain-containing protein n=1 Tax=Microbacterium marinilacus TaxID=415209 RepID=A0ABP7BAX8_9MICO|nr:phosphotransferase [Microbacterium marinilacus]MBY0687147.1 phosphotransferase [Microbacterium marinilacus]